MTGSEMALPTAVGEVDMESIETLIESPGGANLLSPEIAAAYGGGLSFGAATGSRPYMIANFVESLDGIASYRIAGRACGAEIGGFNEADRFIMAVLRSCADAIIVGQNTLVNEARAPYTAESLYPELAEAVTRQRAAAGKRRFPVVAVLSDGISLDLSHPVFHTEEVRALILTSNHGADVLQWKTEEMGKTKVVPVGAGSFAEPADALQLIRQEWGAELCLHEGGPGAIGPFFEQGLIDELFLTFAPRIAGQDPRNVRPGLGQGMTFDPDTSPHCELLSLKRQGSHLFSRYRVDPGATQHP